MTAKAETKRQNLSFPRTAGWGKKRNPTWEKSNIKGRKILRAVTGRERGKIKDVGESTLLRAGAALPKLSVGKEWWKSREGVAARGKRDSGESPPNKGDEPLSIYRKNQALGRWEQSNPKQKGMGRRDVERRGSIRKGREERQSTQTGRTPVAGQKPPCSGRKLPFGQKKRRPGNIYRGRMRTWGGGEGAQKKKKG